MINNHEYGKLSIKIQEIALTKYQEEAVEIQIIALPKRDKF